MRLPLLLAGAERVATDKESDDDLKLLLLPGSSLGGARPKATVRDRDGHLALAKFPHPRDDIPIVLWEGVALSLAHKAGITVPQWRMEKINKKPVLLLRRFDRADGRRIPFLSAMSMLNAYDNETRSYLQIANVLRQHSTAVKADLKQLWRRILFNILISNTDDHLRNHGFLYEGRIGWHLSPAYDLNPSLIGTSPRILSTAITEDNPTASIDLALATAESYGLKPPEAQTIAAEVAKAVSGWRNEARRMGIPTREAEHMATAFEHEDLEKARSFPA